jgi:hypothetical protein
MAVNRNLIFILAYVNWLYIFVNLLLKLTNPKKEFMLYVLN